MISSLRVQGCFFLALLLFLCLVGLPSSQAADVFSVQATLEDWDEADPAEDRGLLPLSDHQPDMAGACPNVPGIDPPSCMASAQPHHASSSVLKSSFGTRAPPIL